MVGGPFPTGGQFPANLVIDPQGTVLYVDQLQRQHGGRLRHQRIDGSASAAAGAYQTPVGSGPTCAAGPRARRLSLYPPTAWTTRLPRRGWTRIQVGWTGLDSPFSGWDSRPASPWCPMGRTLRSSFSRSPGWLVAMDGSELRAPVTGIFVLRGWTFPSLVPESSRQTKFC